MLAVTDLSCREFVELVTDYLDGVLSDALRARFDAHLSICPPCVTYLAQMRMTIATAGRIVEDDLTPEARSKLLDAFRTWKTEELASRSEQPGQ